jgi:hypothetical protein
MLWPEADGVFAASASIEQQIECEAIDFVANQSTKLKLVRQSDHA